MSRIRSTGNATTEGKFRTALISSGIGGFDIQPDVEGRPDIAFVENKVAVFLDGCFWHGCDVHWRPPKTNRGFWLSKIRRNRRRDAHILRRLVSMGWKVFRVWEHDIADDATLAGIVLRVARAADRQDCLESYQFLARRTNHHRRFLWCGGCCEATKHHKTDLTGYSVYHEVKCQRCGRVSRRLYGVAIGGSNG